jgi:O-acetyl-ADP-ribose deacetylase (regulator of RNase III)
MMPHPPISKEHDGGHAETKQAADHPGREHRSAAGERGGRDHGTGQRPDTGPLMAKETTPSDDSDYEVTLDGFCRSLRRLHAECGGPPVRDLAKLNDIPLKRSQIYDVLAGRTLEPPRWDFVQAFVARCQSHAKRHGRIPSMSTDLAWWRQEHALLTRLRRRSRARQETRIPPALARGRKDRPIQAQTTLLYRLEPGDGRTPKKIGIITGDIRQVRCADIWVNSENTDMVMARVQESSISAIIRYEGSVRDTAGRVVHDLLADALEAKVRGHRPVTPGLAVVTGPGELLRRNGVSHIIHVAAVHGEPGSGFHPVKALDRCVVNALGAAEQLDPAATILFPLLATGIGGGPIGPTTRTLITAAVNYLGSVPASRVDTVLFLAYTQAELHACRRVLEASGLEPIV